MKDKQKTLVVYFSYSGTTEKMARMIAERVGGDLFELVPETPYPKDYNACVTAAKREKNAEARPALKSDLADKELIGYETVMIGYPIWWYDAPMIVYTFLEKHSFDSKTIVPFATSGGSGFSGSEQKIAKISKAAAVKKGLLLGENFNGGSIAKWLETIG